MIDNKKYVKRGQALIIWDDPQIYDEVTGANRNKVGASSRYAESLFAVLTITAFLSVFHMYVTMLVGTVARHA